MAGKMGKFNYISDDGTTYTVREDASNAAAQASHVASVSRPNLPHGYVERYLLAVDDHDVTGGRTPTNLRRRVSINDVTDPLWTGGTANITLPDFTVTPSVAVAWAITARIGEKRTSR